MGVGLSCYITPKTSLYFLRKYQPPKSVWVSFFECGRLWKFAYQHKKKNKKKTTAFWPLNSLDKACVALQRGAEKALALKCISFCLWQFFWNWTLPVRGKKAEELSHRALTAKIVFMLIAQTCTRRGRCLKNWYLLVTEFEMMFFVGEISITSQTFNTVLVESRRFVINLIVLC